MTSIAPSRYPASRASTAADPFAIDPYGDPFDDLPASGSGSGIRSRLTLASNLVLRRRKPKLAYAAVVIVGVLAIVVTQLLLSVGLSNGAYQIESLQEKLDGLSSPQNLAASAESLGMVSSASPVYLRLSDGAVLGTPKPAAAGTGTFTGGQSSLVPNAAAAAATAAPAAGTAAAGTAAAGTPAAAGTAAAQAATTPSAPAAAESTPTVAWSGDLPSPTTH